jgi:hypothetical protein
MFFVMLWFSKFVFTITKSLLVRSVVIFGFSLITLGIFASIFIVSRQEGKEGLNNYFHRAGEKAIETIIE